ncbi:MAG: Asp23/Gls24 family envelope stress response protein [Clostridia bacterium]|nr:Asp23/Gls24 family envelope stress response protein [Clostridia bacterium]
MNGNQRRDQNVVLADEVVAKIVSLATLDVDGVCAMAPSREVQTLLKSGDSRCVIVKKQDGALNIDLYVKLNMGVKIASVCERIQQSVKKSVQNMTGYAVTQVNVHVVDIDIADESLNN